MIARPALLLVLSSIVLGACGAQTRDGASINASEVWVISTDDVDDLDFARASVERNRERGVIAHLVVATHDSGVETCRISRTAYANDDQGVIELTYSIFGHFDEIDDIEGTFYIDATPAPGVVLPDNWIRGHDHAVRNAGTAPAGTITLPLLPIETDEIRIHWSTQ